MKRLVSHLLATAALVFLLSTVAFATVPSAAVPPTVVPPAAAPTVTPPATPTTPQDEIVITEPKKEPSQNDIIFEDAGDPTARDSATFLNPDTSVASSTPPEPPPEPNRPVGDYSDKYYYTYGREYAQTFDMATELTAYLKLNLPTSTYGGMVAERVAGTDLYNGICELQIWVIDKAAVEAALDKYPYKKCKLKFFKADYSMKDFESIKSEILLLDISKTSRMNISIYQRLNRLSVSVMTTDYANLAKLCEYIDKSPFKAAIRFSVQSEPNPDT